MVVFVAISTLGLLLKTEKGNRHVLIITDEYSRLTRAEPIARFRAITVECIFFDAWIVPLGKSSYFLADNGIGFVSKVLAAFVSVLV